VTSSYCREHRSSPPSLEGPGPSLSQDTCPRKEVQVPAWFTGPEGHFNDRGFQVKFSVSKRTASLPGTLAQKLGHEAILPLPRPHRHTHTHTHTRTHTHTYTRASQATEAHRPQTRWLKTRHSPWGWKSWMRGQCDWSLEGALYVLCTPTALALSFLEGPHLILGIHSDALTHSEDEDLTYEFGGTPTLSQ
jgi:hypothetical protein